MEDSSSLELVNLTAVSKHQMTVSLREHNTDLSLTAACGLVWYNRLPARSVIVFIEFLLRVITNDTPPSGVYTDQLSKLVMMFLRGQVST